MKKVHLLILLLNSSLLIVGFGFFVENNNSSTSNVEEIKIGKQTWMANNLAVTEFRNGDKIPIATSNDDWKAYGSAHEPVCGYFKNDSDDVSEYGLYYNWWAVIDPRGLAPEGWKIPNNNDWEALTKTLGGREIAGAKLKTQAGWEKGGNGTNSSGFSAYPAGECSHLGYRDRGIDAYFWSSTTSMSNFSDNAPSFFLNNKKGEFVIKDSHKGMGFSVRCVKM